MTTLNGAQATNEGGSTVMIGPVRRGLRASLDHVTSVGYGVIYDYIFERFAPYQQVKHEVLELVESAVPAGARRRDVHILDVGCGPGNFSLMLAEAGFSVTGLDTYDALVDLAQEKRRVRRLPNLAFAHGDLARDRPFRPESFDQVVNVHFLYAHLTPLAILQKAHRVLKPGGHAVFVNLTRRVKVGRTFENLYKRVGLRAAVHSLLWVVPNTIFETFRRPVAPNYWDESEFTAHLSEAGFEVLQMRRTFLEGASILAWVRKKTVS